MVSAREGLLYAVVRQEVAGVQVALAAGAEGGTRELGGLAATALHLAVGEAGPFFSEESNDTAIVMLLVSSRIMQ